MRKLLLIFFSLCLFASVEGQTSIIRAWPFARAQVVASGSSEPPAFLAADGHTDNWYMADEGITLSGSDVTEWADQSGNGIDLTPLWGGTPSVDVGVVFNADAMTDGGVSATTQPLSVYIVFRYLSWPGTSGNRYIIFNAWGDGDMRLVTTNQETGQINFQVNGTGAIVPQGQLTQGNFGILRIRLDGASSYFQVNNNASQNFDASTDAFNAITFHNETYFEVAEMLVRDQIDSAGDQTSIMDYLNNKWSLGL